MNKQSGVSVVSFLVAILVLGIGGLAMLNVVSTNLRATKTVENKQELVNLMNEIKLALMNPALCPNLFRNSSDTNLEIPRPSVGSALTVHHLTAGAKIIGTTSADNKLPYGTRVTILQLRPAANPSPQGSDYTQYLRLHIEAQKNASAFGDNTVTMKIDSPIIEVQTDGATNLIEKCGLNIASDLGPCTSPLPGGGFASCAGGTAKLKIDTYTLIRHYWVGTPVACLNVYAYTHCQDIKTDWKNSTQPCPYDPGDNGAQYVVAKSIDLNRACSNYCGGLLPGPSPKSCYMRRPPGWPATSPVPSELVAVSCGSPAPGNFNYGRYLYCDSSDYITVSTDKFSNIWCECNK